MDIQNIMGTNLHSHERLNLERLADNIETIARSLDKNALIFDKDYNEVSIRGWLMGLSWDVKQVARKGTPSEGV